MNATIFANTPPVGRKCPSQRRFFPMHRRVRACNVLYISGAWFSKKIYDEFTIINMLIFERSYDIFMILSYDKVMITNNFTIVLAKQTQMAHLPTLVGNEKVKKK